MSFDFNVIIEYLPLLLKGTLTTISVAALAIVLATFFGLLVALARMSSNAWVRGAAFCYIWVMRGTPLLLVLYFIYFAGPGVGIRMSAFITAVVGMTLVSTAYKAEIFRAGIQAVPKGQIDAANAVGMSYWLQMRRVVLPQAVKIIIPPYINNTTSMVKDSALISVITVADLMLTSTQIVSTTFRAFEILGTAGLIYLILTSILMTVQLISERKLAVSTR
ncbi:MAG: Glutamine transport system permease protein GlnP [Glaciihabitans sp.]|nr:Glutamine transport system permease protein GlnP [Glaciihabitans sp.]